MNRDLVIQVALSVDAQLRRIERLSSQIGDATEHKVRIPPLIAEARRTLQSMTDRLAQQEGGSPQQ